VEIGISETLIRVFIRMFSESHRPTSDDFCPRIIPTLAIGLYMDGSHSLIIRKVE